jgi:hypothetical protein
MPDENKPSTLGDQIKSAQESMRNWPEWMREAARFSGQPGPGESSAQQQSDRTDSSEKSR